MHDLSHFRNNFEKLAERLATRGGAINLDGFRDLDLKRRSAISQAEQLKARKNQESLEIGKLKREGADLISTDLMMPAMDGYRLIREVRELPPPLGLRPILVLSVNSGEDDMVRCLSAGADDYVLKPLSPQVYIEKLWRLYLRSRR